jgi:hypothetical protein
VTIISKSAVFENVISFDSCVYGLWGATERWVQLRDVRLCRWASLARNNLCGTRREVSVAIHGHKFFLLVLFAAPVFRWQGICAT